MRRLFPSRRREGSRRRRLKLVLLSVLAVGALGSITVKGVYAVLSGQDANPGASIAAGTLTMSNRAAADSASTTLTANVGVTTLSANLAAPTTLTSGVGTTTTLTAATAETTLNVGGGGLTATATSINHVNSITGFPSVPFTIQVDSEQMTVTAESGGGNTTWTVVRGVNGTTAATHANGANVDLASISVASAANFPSSGNYTVQVDSEQMTVIGGQGTTTWSVLRGVNGTTTTTHSSSANVTSPTITVASSSGFPSVPFTVAVGSEQMTVTAESGTGNTVWTVTRGANSTTAAVHLSGAAVGPTVSVTSASSFPSSGNYTIRVDNEQMTVTGGQGTTTWVVTRGVNGTSVASHSSGATVLQNTVSVTSATGFPSSGNYTVLVDSEKMMVIGGQGTLTWTVIRAVDGTSAAAHTSGATIATKSCKSQTGTGNLNSSCDAFFSYSPAAESYPGTPVTARLAIVNTGSINASDLEVWMPSCLRGVTPDAPWASSTPAAPSFSGASNSGGSLLALTTYYYEITAVSASGESIAGSEASYTVPLGTSTNQITLTWAAVSGATSYKVYRGTTQGGELLLASGISGTTYTDNTATTPSGSPPSGTGSGNPCAMGGPQFYVQETNSSGTATYCWYPTQAAGSCAFDTTYDLGVFAQYINTLGTAQDLGSGPTATNTRYFTLGLQFRSTSANALQGTTANFTLIWHFQG